MEHLKILAESINELREAIEKQSEQLDSIEKRIKNIEKRPVLSREDIATEALWATGNMPLGG